MKAKVGDIVVVRNRNYILLEGERFEKDDITGIIVEIKDNGGAVVRIDYLHHILTWPFTGSDNQ